MLLRLPLHSHWGMPPAVHHSSIALQELALRMATVCHLAYGAKIVAAQLHAAVYALHSRVHPPSTTAAADSADIPPSGCCGSAYALCGCVSRGAGDTSMKWQQRVAAAFIVAWERSWAAKCNNLIDT